MLRLTEPAGGIRERIQIFGAQLLSALVLFRSNTSLLDLECKGGPGSPEDNSGLTPGFV